MDLKSGLPFWLIKNGLLYNYPKLETSINTEVAILGGGISGAITAYYLTLAGFNCVVLDSRSIGQGSTCASTSLLQYEIDVPLSKLQKKIGYKDAVRSYTLCADAILKLQDLADAIGFNEFELKKSLYYASSKKDVSFLKEEYEIRKENNFDVSLLDKENIEKEFGFQSPGAILSGLAAQTDAYSFTHALHQFNIKKGCKVFDRSEIVNIKHDKNGVTLTTKNKQKIQAKKLVYATGYEAVNYVHKKIVDLKSTYAIISEHTNDHKQLWKDDALIWNTADPYLYMRTTSDKRIITGGRDEDFYNPAKRDNLIASKSKQLQKDFKKIFTDIEFNIAYSWTGTFGATKDGLPFIGTYAPLPNSYFALGFGGNGITFSLIAAEIIRDLISGKSNADAKIFGFERI